jgi:pyruvate carboxylase
MEKQKRTLAVSIGREPSEEEFILYLMHPKDALQFIQFRDMYGEAPLVLPTDVWLEGLRKTGGKVDFEFNGKPCTIELLSVGGEHDGYIHVVMSVNNKTRVYKVSTPRAKQVEIRMAKGPLEIGAPINGNLWRIGNPKRGMLKVGDIVHQGEEIASIEAMKMENAVTAPFDAQIEEICVKLNGIVQEGQTLFVLRQDDQTETQSPGSSTVIDTPWPG